MFVWCPQNQFAYHHPSSGSFFEGAAIQEVSLPKFYFSFLFTPPKLYVQHIVTSVFYPL
jgi:hypothetical protein